MMDPRAEDKGKAVATRDPGTGHFYVSIAKSVARLFAFTLLAFSGISLLMWAGIILILAELLGIAEELVD